MRPPALSPTAVIDNGQPGYAETGTLEHGPGRFQRHQPRRRDDRWQGRDGHGLLELHRSGRRLSTTSTSRTRARARTATAAPFSVLDSGTTLGTASINESILVTQSQGGLTQGSYGGVGWLELGAYHQLRR